MRPERAQGSIAGFDGLRAIAALSIVGYHVSHNLSPNRWFAPLLWELKAGVTVFFVISGALLYLPYARSMRDRRELPDWRAYVRRRAVRILPGYWVALTVVAIAPLGSRVIGADIWTYYGLSQIYDPQTVVGGLGQAWSLCVEVSFYALLPVFAVFTARCAGAVSARRPLKVQIGLIAALGSASLAARGLLAGTWTTSVHDYGRPLMVALPGLLDWFAIGMLLAVLAAELEAGRGWRRLDRLARWSGCCLPLAAVMFLVGAPRQGGDIFLPWYGLFTHLAIGLGSGLLVLAVIVSPAGREAPWPVRLLRGRVLGWVGTISYGIYLWHVAVLELIKRALGPASASADLGAVLLMWLAVTAGALVLGAASWYLVERPAQRFLRPTRPGQDTLRLPGHMPEIGAPVQSTIDPLNSAPVAVDHLA